MPLQKIKKSMNWLYPCLRFLARRTIIVSSSASDSSSAGTESKVTARACTNLPTNTTQGCHKLLFQNYGTLTVCIFSVRGFNFDLSPFLLFFDTVWLLLPGEDLLFPFELVSDLAEFLRVRDFGNSSVSVSLSEGWCRFEALVVWEVAPVRELFLGVVLSESTNSVLGVHTVLEVCTDSVSVKSSSDTI